jgi:hypothetical protein
LFEALSFLTDITQPLQVHSIIPSGIFQRAPQISLFSQAPVHDISIVAEETLADLSEILLLISSSLLASLESFEHPFENKISEAITAITTIPATLKIILV